VTQRSGERIDHLAIGGFPTAAKEYDPRCVCLGSRLGGVTPSENRLLAVLDSSQQRAIDLLAATYRDRGHWPPWQFLEQSIEKEGSDPFGVIESLPHVGAQSGIYGLTYGLVWTQGSFGSLYQPRDPIGLTVVGWHRARAEDVVHLFLGVLQLAVRKIRDFTPDPDQVVEILLTHSEVEGALREHFGGALPLSGPQLYELLNHEPAMWSGSHGLTAEGEWRWELSRWLKRYEYITTIEGYVDAITAFAEERSQAAGQLVPGLVLRPDTSELNYEYDLGDGLQLSVPADGHAGQRPKLFLSWGRPASKRIARALEPILESNLPGVEVFFSPRSIEPGDDPMVRLFDESLLRSNALVVVLTEEGAGSPYVIWETAAAWALSALVIPMFVDIEPNQVPGPLATKVQGIQLRDREDLVRALTRLRRRFDVEGPAELSDDEWDSLQTALGPRASSPHPESQVEQTNGRPGQATPLESSPVPQPGWPRSELVVYYCGPTSWCQWSGPELPDLTLRVAVALPAAIEQPFQNAVSLLHGERREVAVLTALARSPVNRWLTAQKEVWGWHDEPEWHAYGNSYPDLSEYRFVPSWSNTPRHPLQARLSVATGVPRGALELPGVHIALDVMFQLLELDEHRRPSGIRHQTTPAPVPAAFGLGDVADTLLVVLSIGDLAVELSGQLLPHAYSTGEVAIWVQPRGVELQRVVHLEGIKRLAGAADASCGLTAASWPLGVGGGPDDPRQFIVDMLLDYLERSGYRQLEGRLDSFRHHS
jgi:hypothetical protein